MPSNNVDLTVEISDLLTYHHAYHQSHTELHTIEGEHPVMKSVEGLSPVDERRPYCRMRILIRTEIQGWTVVTRMRLTARSRRGDAGRGAGDHHGDHQDQPVLFGLSVK